MPSPSGVVFANVFSQVLPVSVAEVMVCWAVIGLLAEAVLRRRLGRVAPLVTWIVAAAAFGLYHFAHSPPYNTWRMVVLLGGVGLLTSAFFFGVREIYGTLLLHNAMASAGVTKVMMAANRLGPLTKPRTLLYVTAAFALIAMLLLDAFVIRRPPGIAGVPHR